jgi:ATP-dependent RNA helicase DDX56/DBP9
VVLALLRLGLLHKRVLLFVNSIDAGFRLRLFLESFGLRAAVLNAELPVNSRHHILQVCPRSVRMWHHDFHVRIAGWQ